MENKNFERKQGPIIKNEEEIKKEILEQAADTEANNFFDSFIEKNLQFIKSEDIEKFNKVGLDLKMEIKNLLEATKNNKGEEYADLLIRKFAACLDIYRPIVADPRDQEVKVAAKEYVLELLAPGGKNSGLNYGLDRK